VGIVVEEPEFTPTQKLDATGDWVKHKSREGRTVVEVGKTKPGAALDTNESHLYDTNSSRLP